MSESPIRAFEDPLRVWRLRHSRHEPEQAHPMAHVWTALLSAKPELFEPLTVVMDPAYFDPDTDEDVVLDEVSAWCLEVDDDDPRYGPTWRPPALRVVVPSIDRASLDSITERAIEKGRVNGHEMMACYAAVRAIRARLFEVPEAEWLELRPEWGAQTVAVERDADGIHWVRGTGQHLMRPPFEVVVTRGMELSIEAFWSPWYEPGRPGTKAIDAWVETLLQLGWERDDSRARR